MVFDPSDVVTMIRGKHVLHFGGEFAFYRDDTTAWGNINAGTLQFSGQYTENWTLERLRHRFAQQSSPAKSMLTSSLAMLRTGTQRLA